mgnify:CR=1 FL=1
MIAVETAQRPARYQRLGANAGWMHAARDAVELLTKRCDFVGSKLDVVDRQERNATIQILSGASRHTNPQIRHAAKSRVGVCGSRSLDAIDIDCVGS